MENMKIKFSQRWGSQIIAPYQVFELVVITLLGLLLALNLLELLQVNVWRPDSMYYVDSYTSKVIEEGRWINQLFFPILKLMPAWLAISLSYVCLGYFAYCVAKNITLRHGYSIAFALLCLSIPVLPVQLEWPETLLVAFLLLAVAPHQAKKMPDYIFFPLFSILFFGTLSSFYFLLPLLFLAELNSKKTLRLLVIWATAFVVGYIVTNTIVYISSGSFIQIAGWREPHPIKELQDIGTNAIRLYESAVNAHYMKFQTVLGQWLILATAVIGGACVLFKRSFFAFLVSIIAALGIYASTLPVGIFVQERSLLSCLIGLLVAFLLHSKTQNWLSFFLLCLVLVLGVQFSNASRNTILWFKTTTEILQTQFAQAIPYPPEEVRTVFIIFNPEDNSRAFTKIDQFNEFKHPFSESLQSPLNWVAVLKTMGYKRIFLCEDPTSWACESLEGHYEETQVGQPEGIFWSKRLGKHDLMLMLNQDFARSQ